MSRRIEVELTSKVDDETWTWRAAGARQPKGTLAAKLLPGGAKVGDVLRAEVENDIDGIAVLALMPVKEKAAESGRLELIPRPERNEPAVTQSRAPRDARDPRERREPRGRERERDRGDRPPRPARPERPARPDRPERSERRPERERSDRSERRPPRAPRPAPEPAPERQQYKRLSPGHVFRNKVLEALPPEQKVIAEQVLRGGLPAVRQAIETQNAALAAENRPTVKPGPLVAIAEDLLPLLKTAEWRDRADAAVEAGDDISLRDLRSVVTSAEARDDEAREIARTLRERLDARMGQERDAWLAEINDALAGGRVVRALRIASRAPDPAMRFPDDVAGQLAEAAGAAMAPDAPPDRWLAVLDAVSVSPVRRSVTPAGLPPDPPAAFVSTASQAVSRVPALGPLLGISMPPPPTKRVPPPKPAVPQRQPPGAAAPATDAAPAEPADELT